jgi:DNA modification methylase
VDSGSTIPETPRGVPPRAADQARAALDQGRFLPDELRNLLFETKREYELTYAEKRREADILAETMAVPLQPVKTFGDSHGEWSNKLVFGDNLQVLKTLLQMKERGELVDSEGKPGATLIYIDPPFATQQEFRGPRDEKAYQDKVAGAFFLEFLRKRLVFLRELLTASGTIYLHLDTRKVHYAKLLMDEVFGEQHFRNEIIWQRTTSHSDSQRFGAVHETILAYGRSSAPIWKTMYVPYDQEFIDTYYKYEDGDGRLYWTGDITAAGLRKGETGKPWRGVDPAKIGKGRHWVRTPAELEELDAQGRIYWPKDAGIPKLKRYLDEMPGLAVPDVWTDIPSLGGLGPTSAERTGYPTQKPLKLVTRIVEASSRPGDIVLDAFLGSGTTAVAAEKLGRRWIGIDCGKLAIYTSQRQLLRMGADKRSILAPVSPFTLYNAGLYDFDLLKNMPWEDFRRFALDLFQCRDETHSVGKLVLDGYLGLDHVLVFNFLNHPRAALDEAFIEDLHKAIGDRIGRSFFVIAPAASVQFLEDYIELEGPRHPIRFFVLRIPYSVIDEIHHRGFTRLQQPNSLDTVNDTVDSIGFDFIQPPTVRCTYTKSKTELKVKIREFETEAMTRNGDSPLGFDALAMVMVDMDYDGKVFDLDQVFYADELQEALNVFLLPSSSAGRRLMIIYVDVYGNEHREVKRISEFRTARGKA